jgi:hypothetical protein
MAPPAAVAPSPARRLRDALEPIATQGWWSPHVLPRLERLGVGQWEGYAWGRAAALGEADAAVVVAAFGVFDPELLTALYERGRAACSRADILAAREGGAEEGLAAALGDRPEVAVLADALHAALAGAAATARPLFSGLRALPLPASPHGRLWRSAELFREHRGDSHLAACVAAGLAPVEMNVVTELAVGYPATEYSATRGFSPDVLAAAVASLAARGLVADGALTEAGSAFRAGLEAATDAAQAAVVDALGDEVDELVAMADALSELVVASGAFPVDGRKRAAG